MAQSSADTLRLLGLDGSNPLGFLAALGLLRVLDHRARVAASPRPRLEWIDDGYWLPVVHDGGDVESVVHAVIDDKATWKHDPAFTLAYDETGEHLIDALDRGAIRDLKPKPAAMREFLDRVAGISEQKNLSGDAWLAARRSMDTAAVYGSELIQDNNGNTKPLALHFSAGQQRFLDAVGKLQEGITEDDVREALLGPWKGTSTLPSMSWDATVARIYALRASDPSAEKRGSVPGADWLAFIALGLLRVTPHGRGLVTTGVRGGWKDSTFTWPLWIAPATASVIGSLVATPHLERLTVGERRARGIGVIFASAIMRADQGGYGSFAPARVA